MSDNDGEFNRRVDSSLEGFYVSGADDTRHYIRLGGKTVSSFNSGWAPMFLYSGLPGLHLLEFCHQSGRRATWLLNERFERLCNSVRNLPSPFDKALRVGARALQADVWIQLMLAPVPTLQPATRAFFQINKSMRAQVLEAAQGSGTLGAGVIDISAHAEPTLRGDLMHGEVLLQRTFLEAIIGAPTKELFIEACKTGILSWPSPIDGEPMRLLGGLFLDDFRLAYRMLDGRTGLIVVIVVSEHHNRTIAVFLPQSGLTVVLSGPDARLLESHFGRLAPTLERHLWDHALVLERYFGKERFAFASVLRGHPGVHIGHQLWNELSPIEDVVRAVPPDFQPLYLVPNAIDGTEIYGPIDTLFPELSGRVLRFDRGVKTIVPEAYAQHLCVMRITDDRVSASLRSRILAFANASKAGCEARAAAEAISASGLPIVLIGLRVENRTLVDLPHFLIGFIEQMIARIGPAVFVLDGHNRRVESNPEVMWVSHWEHAAANRPQDVEWQIVELLEAHFANTQARIVSTIGAPIASSLVWSHYSRMFFAIWGAGLAKYRWVANTPGLVVSSAWNLRHRDDLHIYDAPRYMEDPTQLLFVDPACVTDRADQQPMVVPSGTLIPSYANFDVSVEALWPQLEVLLQPLQR